MLLILPLGGEGTWAVRTGSSIVMETPDFCWLMDLRVKVSPKVTKKRAQSSFQESVLLAHGSLPFILYSVATLPSRCANMQGQTGLLSVET